MSGYIGSDQKGLSGSVIGKETNQTFMEFGQVVNKDTTLESNKNILSVGPLTVADGVTVTVGENSNWVIV